MTQDRRRQKQMEHRREVEQILKVPILHSFALERLATLLFILQPLYRFVFKSVGTTRGATAREGGRAAGTRESAPQRGIPQGNHRTGATAPSRR